MTGQPADAIDIAGLSADSRAVKPGYLFAALPGFAADGRAFIDDAVARGASAVLAPPGARLSRAALARGVRLVTDADPRRRLAELAARYFGRQPAVVAAVTGTNGKTSVAAFTRQIWRALGHRAASLGTLGLTAPGIEGRPTLTTPDPIALHRDLAKLARSGVDRLALEASSHGLEQRRLDAASIAAAAFTNLSRDHLDHHGTMAAYRAAKLRLFSDLATRGGGAVLNADADDVAAFRAAAAGRGLRSIDYGVRARDLRIDRLRPHAGGQTLDLVVFGERRRVDLPLPGAFQAANALCALGLAIACGDEWEPALAALPRLEGVPGRLQLAARGRGGAPIYVDYAHTPDALANALSALRPHTEGRLTVVFGCGGDRDPGKRPLMGAAAHRHADAAIVTDDNPRGEDAAEIRRQVRIGCPEAREIGDRAEAIRIAVAGLDAGDVLAIAGKGHESGQIVGGEVRPFDDVDAARRAAKEIAG